MALTEIGIDLNKNQLSETLIGALVVEELHVVVEAQDIPVGEVPDIGTCCSSRRVSCC